MPKMPGTFNAFPSRSAGNDKRILRRADGKKIYDYRWQKESKAFLERNPLCVMCEEEGITEAATRVDHIIPHRGDETLFRDVSNWQPLCTTHHQSDKQRIERRLPGRGGSKV